MQSVANVDLHCPRGQASPESTASRYPWPVQCVPDVGLPSWGNMAAMMDGGWGLWLGGPWFADARLVCPAHGPVALHGVVTCGGMHANKCVWVLPGLVSAVGVPHAEDVHFDEKFFAGNRRLAHNQGSAGD